MSLMQKIISWQQDTARREHLEPFMVLPFGTIKEIVKIKPKTSDALLRIKGIGPVKVRKYGDEILAIVRGEGITGIKNEELKVAGKKIPAFAGMTNNNGGSLFDEADVVNEMAGDDKIPASAGMTGEEMKFDEVTGEVVEEMGESAISVSEFVGMLDTMLRTNFRGTRVQGEIVGFKRNPNGHAYFEIKDKSSILRCAVFKNSYELSGIELEDGMEVIVTGEPNYHKQYGFSFIGQTVELCGEGALKKAYEKLKKKFEQEGLLAQERKRELPKLPKRIGLITSRSGAAIGDFTTNVGNYGYKIIFHHSSVEGANALVDLESALTTMAKKDIDVLVIVRGGGSLESLQAFNNEKIVRMIADFPVPVVAGVGHEQDETLTTLVADVGVSTPTAAAHAVRDSWDRVDKFISSSEQYILRSFEKALSGKKMQLSQQEFAVKNIFDTILQDAKDLFAKFDFGVQKLQNEITSKKRVLQNNLGQLSHSLDKIVLNYNRTIQDASNVLLGFQSVLETNKKQIIFYEKTLSNYDPKNQLARGYSITTDKSGKVVRSKKQIKKGDEIITQLTDGTVKSKVEK